MRPRRGEVGEAASTSRHRRRGSCDSRDDSDQSGSDRISAAWTPPSQCMPDGTRTRGHPVRDVVSAAGLSVPNRHTVCRCIRGVSHHHDQAVSVTCKLSATATAMHVATRCRTIKREMQLCLEMPGPQLMHDRCTHTGISPQEASCMYHACTGSNSAQGLRRAADCFSAEAREHAM